MLWVYANKNVAFSVVNMSQWFLINELYRDENTKTFVS